MSILTQYRLQPLWNDLHSAVQKLSEINELTTFHQHLQTVVLLLADLSQAARPREDKFGKLFPSTLVCKTYYWLTPIEVVCGELVCSNWHLGLHSAARRTYIPHFPKLPSIYSYFKKAYAGDAWAQGKLAESYRSLPNQQNNTFKWAKKSVEGGDAGGENTLGLCYFVGIGVPKNRIEGLRLIQSSASRNHPRGQTQLALFYLEGVGSLPCDPREALRLMRLAAAAGDYWAQCRLGLLTYTGEFSVANKEEGLKLMKMSACQGYGNAAAILGGWHFEGNGVEKDEGKGYRFFLLAAYNNDESGEYNLGSCYKYGLGCLPDEKAALKWWHLCAQRGHQDSQYELGVMYEKTNLEQSIHYYKSAATQGHMNARKALHRILSKS